MSRHLKVVEQRVQHILRADGLRDVTERVHGGAADGLLVSLEHLQELEANPHPLSSAHVLGPPIRDSTHEIDTVLLHLKQKQKQNGSSESPARNQLGECNGATERVG